MCVEHIPSTSSLWDRTVADDMHGKEQGPQPDARIVYMDGAFDLFHAGHVEVGAASLFSLSIF
jgi:bifunctional ADP-heptose synthase (sugar kinase/adenylyltransferase)